MNKGRRSNTSACERCKIKKRRCDNKIPKCSLCDAAGVDCVSYDAITRRPVPRSYVHDLEERVRTLEAALRRGSNSVSVQGHSPTAPRSSSPATREISAHEPSSYNIVQAQQSASHHARPDQPAEADLAATRSPQHASTSSPVEAMLTDLIGTRTAAHVPDVGTSDNWLGDDGLSVEDIEPWSTDLPPQKSVRSLITAYLHISDQSLPLLHRPWLHQKLDVLYPAASHLNSTTDTAEVSTAVFFVLEVCAIALAVLQKYYPSRVTISMADRYHKRAISTLTDAGLPKGIEGVQALVLIAQYSYSHPSKWSEFKLVGNALRSAVDLGLHQDPHDQGMDALALDIRRRTFWAAYSLERNIVISLGLPFCLADGAISTKLPSEQSDDNIAPEGIAYSDMEKPKPKRLGLHLHRYRQLQSEMRTTLYEKLPAALSLVSNSLAEWQQRMHQQLESWYEDTPRSETMTEREKKHLENFEVNYYVALLYLYRPSPNIPVLTDEGLVTLANIAIHVVELYRRFFLRKQLTLYWLAIDNLYQAGTALMYTFAKSVSVRARITLQRLETSVNACSSILWGMVEHCPAFESKRDSFDELLSNALPGLRQLSSSMNTDLVQPNSGSSTDRTASGIPNTMTFPPVAEADQSQDLATYIDAFPNNDYLQLNSSAVGVSSFNTPQFPAMSMPNFDQTISEWDLLEQNADFLIPGWL